MKKRNKGSRQAMGGAASGPTSPIVGQRPQLLPAWLREYRFLAIILGLSLLLGVYEATSHELPKSSAGVQVEWLLADRVNLAQTLVELYPDRSQGYFLRAYQAGMCWERGFQPAVCAHFAYHDLRDVRMALEDALAQGGAKDQEELFHFYAFTLTQFDEPPEVIEAAIEQWRKHYPYSKKPDPRELPRANR